MPNHFIRLNANTPAPWHRFRDNPAGLNREVRRTAKRYDAQVVGGVYFDIGKKVAYVVTKGPDDPVKAKAMIDALPTLKAKVMLRLDEMEAAVAARREAEGLDEREEEGKVLP